MLKSISKLSATSFLLAMVYGTPATAQQDETGQNVDNNNNPAAVAPSKDNQAAAQEQPKTGWPRKVRLSFSIRNWTPEVGPDKVSFKVQGVNNGPDVLEKEFTVNAQNANRIAISDEIELNMDQVITYSYTDQNGSAMGQCELLPQLPKDKLLGRDLRDDATGVRLDLVRNPNSKALHCEVSSTNSPAASK